MVVAYDPIVSLLSLFFLASLYVGLKEKMQSFRVKIVRYQNCANVSRGFSAVDIEIKIEFVIRLFGSDATIWCCSPTMNFESSFFFP